MSGHIEKGEGVIDAIIRETKEEAGIDISSDDLEVTHVMYSKTDRPYVNFFFICEKYSGKICNVEPHKCGGLQFFIETELSSNMVEVGDKWNR